MIAEFIWKFFKLDGTFNEDEIMKCCGIVQASYRIFISTKSQAEKDVYKKIIMGLKPYEVPNFFKVKKKKSTRQGIYLSS